MGLHYRYHRAVVWTSLPLPTHSCEPAPSVYAFDLAAIPPIEEAQIPCYLERSEDGQIYLSVSRVASAFLVQFPGYVDFLIDPLQKAITASPGLPTGTLAHFFLDQLMPRYLSYTGDTAIHTSSVIVDDGAALFLGNSGRGKSTLAAEFYFRGHPAIADDVTFIEPNEGGFQAVQSYPGFRLWPDSADWHDYPSIVQVPVAEDYAKQRLLVDESASTVVEAPIRCAFVLTEPDPALDRVRIAPMRPQEAFFALLQQSLPFIPTDPDVMKREFEVFTLLAAQVPFFSLDYPRSYIMLNRVYHDLRDHIAALP